MSELPEYSSVKRWLVTTNHKDIGILYLVTSLFFLVFGGVLAMLIRVQLWQGGGFMSGTAYNETVTAHGLIMVFWFLSPFAFGFANYFVPLQIGADDLAFPRLNALSYWLYAASGVLFFISFFQGGTLSAGWTIYAPLNLPNFTPSVGSTTAILALAMFVIAVTASTMNFLTTIHHSRAEGMGLWDIPLFSWSILLTVWMMLFAFAALLGAALLLGADRIVGSLFYDATTEGGSLLWGHLFWFFGHPEVYIVFFPALGIMFELFQTFTGRRMAGRKWIIAGLILIAIQSFLVWMHHMFQTAINLEIKTLMMATTIGISLPFDLVVFATIYTLIKGKVQFKTPFLYAFGALFFIIAGGITGIFLGAIVLDFQFRGTYWVVAHFHYIMFGGATALFGGLYYWYPKITGRMYNELWGKIQFVLFFLGFNIVYFSMFAAWETPRRVFDYAAGLAGFHKAGTVGGFILAFSFLILFVNLAYSFRNGDKAGDNPWGSGRTSEWALPSPPPLENWDGRPDFSSGKLEFVKGTADGGHAEEHHADHASIWPFAVSIATLLMFLGLSGITTWENGEITGVSTGYGILTGIGAVAFLGTCLGFGFEKFRAPQAAVAERWPFEGIEKNKLGVWFFLASDVLVFGAVISSVLFIRFEAGWMSWDPLPQAIFGLINTFVLLTSSFTVVLALHYAREGNSRRTMASIGATILLGLTFMSVKAFEWYEEIVVHGVTWASSVQASTYFITTGLHGLHVLLGLLVAVFLVYRGKDGVYNDDTRPVEYFGLYWHFVDIVWVFLFPIFYLF